MDEHISTTAMRRVLTWYLRTAEEVVNTLEGSDSSVFDRDGAGDWYEQERQNLVTASAVAEKMGMDDLAWKLPAVVSKVHASRNHLTDLFETLPRALRAVRRVGDRAGEAEVLENLGRAHTQSANPTEGIAFQQAALAIRSELGDRRGEARAANGIGLACLRTRDFKRARSQFERTRAVAADIDDAYLTAVSLNNLGNVELELEQFADGAELLARALDIHRSLGNRDSEGDTLRGLSRAHRGLGDLDAATEAMTSLHRAATLHRQLGDRSREAAALDATGEACQRAHRFAEAIDFHRGAAATFRELDDRWQLALSLDHLATALAACDAETPRNGDNDALSGAEITRSRAEAADLLRDLTDPLARRIHARLSSTS